MAVYNLTEEFEQKVPRFVFDGKFDLKAHREREEQFLQELKEWCQKRNPTQDQNYIGEIIDFPVADGRALYMVAALKPVQLLHIPLGDGYQYQYAHRLTAKDVKKEVDNKKAFKAILDKHRANKGQQ